MAVGASFGKDTLLSNLEVAKGNVPGHSLLDLSSRALNVFNEQTIIPMSTGIRLARPVDPVDIYIASTSTSDSLKPIFISYLDEEYKERTKVLELNFANSQSPEIAIQQGRRIQLAAVIGPNKAVGDIYFSQGSTFSGGVPSPIEDTMNFIAAADGKTYSGLITVPLDKTLFGQRYTVTCGDSVNCEVEIGVRINVEGFFNDTVGWRQFIHDGPLPFEFGFFSWPQGTDVELVALSAVPAADLDVVFSGFLVDNSLIGPDVLLNQIIGTSIREFTTSLYSKISEPTPS